MRETIKEFFAGLPYVLIALVVIAIGLYLIKYQVEIFSLLFGVVCVFGFSVIVGMFIRASITPHHALTEENYIKNILPNAIKKTLYEGQISPFDSLSLKEAVEHPKFPEFAYWYARNVIKGRWYYGEHIIMKDEKLWNKYKFIFDVEPYNK